MGPPADTIGVFAFKWRGEGTRAEKYYFTDFLGSPVGPEHAQFPPGGKEC